VTGKDLTDTLKEGLEMLTLFQASQEIRKLRGKIDLNINVNELRNLG